MSPNIKNGIMEFASDNNPTDWFSHACVYWILLSASIVTAVDPSLTSNCDHTHKMPCFQGGLPDRIEASVADSALLPCFIYNVDFKSTVITWWKEGEFQEISLGTQINNPGKYALQRASSNEWSLIIKKVSKTDEGIFFCQINLSKLKEKPYKLVVRDIESHNDLNRNGRNFGVPPKTSARPVDYEYVKDEAINNVRKYTVSVSGDSYSYLNEPVSFSCRARFLYSTSDASVNWFHNGALQQSSPERLIDITMRWDKNNTLFSVLTISRVEKKHSGDWTCKKYSSKIIEPKDSSTIPFAVYASKSEPRTLSTTNKEKQSLHLASLQSDQNNSSNRCLTSLIRLLSSISFSLYTNYLHMR